MILFHAELDGLAPHCCHIQAVKRVIQTFDNVNELLPENFLEGYSVCVYVNEVKLILLLFIRSKCPNH